MAEEQTKNHRCFRDELISYREKNQEKVVALNTFTAKDFESLQSYHVSADFKPPVYCYLLSKYHLFLARALKEFAQDESHGLKHFVDANNRLLVLEKKDDDRMLILSRDIFRATIQKAPKADVDEFTMLYDRFQTTLHEMAIKAQERGFVCWMLQDREQEDLPRGGSELRQRATVQHKGGS